MKDETTDVFITEQLTVVKHAKDENIKTSFSGIVPVSSCTGKNIYQECIRFLDKNKF